MSHLFPGNSTQTFEYSYHKSSLSCWEPFYYAHVTFAYLITISGILAMLTRVLPPRFRAYHLYFGRAYILFMLWGTATSLLIHNTGLPIGVIWSFCWVLNGLSIGYIAITIHQQKRKAAAAQALAAGTPPPPTSTKRVSKPIIILHRMLSWKTLHGCVMFVSWINIAGRTFITKVTRDFQCYTYPAYKPLTSKHYTYVEGSGIEWVAQEDPMYGRLPWAYKEGSWAATMLFGPLFGAVVVGLIYLFITVRRDQTVDTHHLNRQVVGEDDVAKAQDRSLSQDTMSG
ncbi:hypothetical protein HDV00_000492 [Rhizophlyctis rosea]|nr:hypothetical protein HDV00_000492 [Rhizophlyctis rosea]